MDVVFGFLSSIFAGATSILSKCGVKNTKSNLATALRTSVVLILAWVIVLINGSFNQIPNLTLNNWIFLLLSGFATGISWLCYFKALSIGEVSKVSAIDKSSTILSILFSLILFSDERINVPIKIACLIFIGIGTYMMIGKINKDKNTKKVYVFFAILSAIFASLTSILAKFGLEGIDSNLATAIRTVVVFIFSWIIVFVKKEHKDIKFINKKEMLFLLFSGIATGLSWLCYYYALSLGQVSVIVSIDRLSVVFTILFSIIFLKEKQSIKELNGLFCLTIGSLFMALLT